MAAQSALGVQTVLLDQLIQVFYFLPFVPVYIVMNGKKDNVPSVDIVVIG